MNKGTFALVGILFALVLFLAVNIVSGSFLRPLRADLTEEKLYTLSDGSKEIARGLEEPITLRYYFSSAGLLAEEPGLHDYGKRVQDILDEFARSSGGNIIVEVVEPEPFSEEEDRAVQEGLFGFPLDNKDLAFMGLVGFDAVDNKETVPFFEPRKERLLEYDLSRLVYQLSHPEKSVVGVLSSLPLEGAPGNPMLQQAATPPWQILAQLQSFFDTRTLPPDLEQIPDDVEVLVVIHPRRFPQTVLYAIDQFVLGGGKALVYVDPHCESDQSDVDPQNPYASIGKSKGSNLDKLFEKWGVEMTSGKVVGDRSCALDVTTQRGAPPQRFVVWMQLKEEGMDDDDPITSLLQRGMLLATPGNLTRRGDAVTEMTPLVRTTDDAMLIDVGSVQFMPNPEDLLTAYVPGGSPLTIAARLHGDVETAFPDGPPPSIESMTDPEAAAPEAEGTSDHLAASTAPIDVIVVSDVDHLQDRFWIQEERLFDQIPTGRFISVADNGSFAINSVENLAGGNELASIRARGKFSRPFERVEEIRRDAEQRNLDEKRLLEAKFEAAQARIDEIQSKKSPDSQFFLSPEQEEELKRAREERIATNKKLRVVRYNLEKDIKRLGAQVKWINILALPVLLVAMALAVGLLPNLRRRS